MTSDDRNNSHAIAKGVGAWQNLTGRGQEKGLLDVQQANPKQSNRRQSNTSEVRLSDSQTSQDDKYQEQDFTTPGKEGNLQCPFAVRIGGTSRLQHPGSLPTPPDARGQTVKDPIAAEIQRTDFASPPPSPTGSASKCPIRFLDQHSPEEVAKYFENHKHEIPRSHEICVKRYQSNTESIRQLDAKYGNLVSMIQGLGIKHQSLLPAKEEEKGEAEVMEQESVAKVEKWAEYVDDAPEGTTMDNTQSNNEEGEDDRKGYFDRPFKEIRVGESPSRPWGISVPFVEGLDLSTTSARISHVDSVQSRAPSQHDEIIPEKAKGSCPFGGGAIQNPHKAEAESRSRTEPLNDDRQSKPKAPQVPQVPKIAETAPQPRMLFTGPVFIGYPAEQAAELMQQYGIGKDPQS